MVGHGMMTPTSTRRPLNGKGAMLCCGQLHMLRLRCLDPGEEVEGALCIRLIIFPVGRARTGHNPVVPQKSQIHKDCEEERKNQSLDASVCSFFEAARRQVTAWIPTQLEQLSCQRKDRQLLGCPLRWHAPSWLSSPFFSNPASAGPWPTRQH